MAVIYGTPVILLQKPDTSEQWLINSVVSLEPYVEAGKEKEFNVNFTSNNTSYSRIMLGGSAHLIMYGDPIINAGSGGNMQDAYRQITLAEPATGELLTWLEANAVRLPLTGTGVFNSAVTNNSSTNRGGVFTFTSNGTAYNGITLTGTGSSLTVKYNAATVYSNGAWSDSAYRTITFTQPIKYEGNEEFIRWFVDNAVQVSAEKATVYKLNESITCSTTQSLSGTSSNLGNLYAYNCTPYFTEIPAGSKILLSNGNLDDLTGITVTGQQKITLKTISNKKYLNPSLEMLMHYSKDVTAGNNTSFLIGSAQTTSGGMTMQGLGKVHCPSSMTYTTNNEILLFSTAPTGDLLTWLNTNTTKI